METEKIFKNLNLKNFDSLTKEELNSLKEEVCLTGNRLEDGKMDKDNFGNSFHFQRTDIRDFFEGYLKYLDEKKVADNTNSLWDFYSTYDYSLVGHDESEVANDIYDKFSPRQIKSMIEEYVDEDTILYYLGGEEEEDEEEVNIDDMDIDDLTELILELSERLIAEIDD